MTGRMHDPLTRLPPPPGLWTRLAACHDLWELMDPPEGERTEYARRAALAVCRSCPVLAECREWVVALPASADPGGVTGGWTEYQRGLERGRRSRARQRAEPRRVAGRGEREDRARLREAAGGRGVRSAVGVRVLGQQQAPHVLARVAGRLHQVDLADAGGGRLAHRLGEFRAGCVRAPGCRPEPPGCRMYVRHRLVLVHAHIVAHREVATS